MTCFNLGMADAGKEVLVGEQARPQEQEAEDGGVFLGQTRARAEAWRRRGFVSSDHEPQSGSGMAALHVGSGGII